MPQVGFNGKAEADAAIAVHAALPAAHHTKTTSGDEISSGTVDKDRIDSEIARDTEVIAAINAHTTPDAHHTAITPTEVDTKVGAEATARDAAIGTHADLPTVHQDAPDLIDTHAGLPNIHHTPPTTRTIATGSYTGDDGAARQITTGFKCSLVIIFDLTAQPIKSPFLIPNAVLSIDGTVPVGNTALHATDGFIVDANAQHNNVGTTYYYWAISE